MTDRETPRQRRFEKRRQQILDVTLQIAESEGWDAVTTRRLAAEIDFSQPVIYQHFSNRDDLINTVVMDGFATLADRIRAVVRSPSPALHKGNSAPLEDLCRAYLDFGSTRPRLYEAMFTLPTALPFAHEDTPPQLRSAFDALADAIASEAPRADSAAAAELFWACCHGLVTLRNAGRIPPERLEQHIRRVAALVRLDAQP